MEIFSGLSLFQILFIFFAILAAYITKGITGSGSAIIGTALLSLVIDIRIAVPSIFILDFIANTGLSYKTRGHSDHKPLIPLLVIHIAMIAVGVWLLRTLELGYLRIILAVLIVFAAAYIPFGYRVNIPNLAVIRIITGFLAGIAGGMFGTSGVFIITYVRTMYKDKSAFRAQVSFIYFIESVARLVFMLIFAMFTKTSIVFSALLMPAMAAGLVAGYFLHGHVNEKYFNYIISLFLIFSGIMLIVKG